VLESFDFSGQILKGALRGIQFQGWVASGAQGSAPDVQLEVEIPRLEMGPELFALLPSGQAEMLRKLKLAGTVWGNASLSFSSEGEVSYGAEVKCADISCSLDTPPLAIRSLSARLRMDEKRIQCWSFVGRAWGGPISGTGIVHLPPEPQGSPRFEGRLLLERGSLEELVSRLEGQAASLKGKLTLSADASGLTDDLNSIEAAGTVSLSDARLVELPLVAGLLNVLSLSLPARAVFDTVELRFQVTEGVVQLGHLFLSSETIDITGKGSITLEGDMDLVVAAATSERPRRGIPILSKALSVVIRGIQETVMPPVRITGKVNEPKFKVMSMEPIKRPLRSLRELVPLLPSPGKKEKE